MGFRAKVEAWSNPVVNPPPTPARPARRPATITMLFFLWPSVGTSLLQAPPEGRTTSAIPAHGASNLCTDQFFYYYLSYNLESNSTGTYM